jgi:hypothetical protein
MQAQDCEQAVMSESTSQRLSSRKASVKLVPPVDPLLAQPPTEVDNAAVALVREVQQALLDILQLDAERVDPR